eukprot:m.31828 g.31828  ORF g.31828 m.31828 type:complete len:79 (-) comp9465_c0_seq2:761-997(-)
MSFFFKGSKTFKPKKNIPEGSHQYNLKKYVDDTLGAGNLALAVKLPDGEDLNEWIAVNSESRMGVNANDIRRVTSYPS